MSPPLMVFACSQAFNDDYDYPSEAALTQTSAALSVQSCESAFGESCMAIGRRAAFTLQSMWRSAVKCRMIQGTGMVENSAHFAPLAERPHTRSTNNVVSSTEQPRVTSPVS